MTELYSHLLHSYEPDVRPYTIHNYPLNITFGFALTQVIDVVSIKQSHTHTLVCRMNEIKC
jgi:hypothetical protein